MGALWNALLSRGGGCGETLALMSLAYRQQGCPRRCWGAVTQVDGLHAAAVWDVWRFPHRLHTSMQVLACMQRKAADVHASTLKSHVL